MTKLNKVKYAVRPRPRPSGKWSSAICARPGACWSCKLADRLHNMRTLRYLPQGEAGAQVPGGPGDLRRLAHRLGMNTVKWELEDLAFATLYPKRFDEIVRLVRAAAECRRLDRASMPAVGGDNASLRGHSRTARRIRGPRNRDGHPFQQATSPRSSGSAGCWPAGSCSSRQRPLLPEKPDREIARRLGLAQASFSIWATPTRTCKRPWRAGVCPVGALWGFRTADELTAGGAKALIEKPLHLHVGAAFCPHYKYLGNAGKNGFVV